MNALQAMKMQLNVARTENGDLAYKSTGSACLDFFSLCGGMRRNLESLDKLFAEKPLLGIPFANKDHINSKGHRLTCASKILEGYVAPYNATVIDRLEKAGAIPLGRCNQDELTFHIMLLPLR